MLAKRAWLKIMLIVAVVLPLAGMTGCGQDSGKTTAQKEKTVSFSRPEDLLNLDPHDHFLLSNWTVEKCIYDYLVDVDQNGKVIPSLATEWKSSPDGKEWTFTLRDGVKFHNGETFDAEAVKVSLERLIKAQLRLAGIWPTLTGVTVVDPKTVVIKFSDPNSAVLSNLSLTAILPPKAFKEQGTKLFEHAIGSGPFTFVEWQPKQRVVMKRFDGYWGKKANVDKIVYLPIFEDSTRIAGVKTGDIDVADTIPADQAKAMASDANVKVVRDLAWDQIYLMFKFGKPPFDDKRVREAVSLALDRESIIKNIIDGGRPSTGLIPKGIFGFNEKLEPIKRDIERAKRLVKEAGRVGTKITIIAPQGTYAKTNEVLQAIRSQIAETGLDVTFQLLDSGAFAEKRGAGNYDLFYVGGAQVGGNVDWFVGTRIVADAFKTGYKNPQLVEAWQRGRQAMDPTKRAEYFDQAVGIMNKEFAPMVFLHQMENIYLVRKEVTGVVFRGDKITDLRYANK